MNHKSILPAIIGSSTAELITLPICTLKTVYQSGKYDIITAISNIYSKRGILGFYSGSTPAILAQIFASTYKLILFDRISGYMPHGDIFTILAGIIASMTCVFFTNPIDYLRVSYQMGNSISLKGIYRGLYPNLAKGLVGGATFLPIRKILINHYPEVETWKMGLCSAVISTTIVHPLDYFKTYLMSSSERGINKSLIRNPYKGLSLNLLRIIPHFVIMTETMDHVKRCI